MAGVLGDKLGRKPVIVIADVLFIAGAVWQSVTNGVWGMIFGRSLIGLAVGAASLVTPLYVNVAYQVYAMPTPLFLHSAARAWPH
jgi:SP family myo-inositol transporter-like MFS transporter 13